MDDSDFDDPSEYLESQCQTKQMSLLWPKETSLCMLLFYLVAERQRVFIQSSVMVSLLCQMIWNV